MLKSAVILKESKMFNFQCIEISAKIDDWTQSIKK